MNPERPSLRHIIIKMPNFKNKDIILKAPRQMQEVMYKGALIGYQFISEQKHYKLEGNGKKYSM